MDRPRHPPVYTALMDSPTPKLQGQSSLFLPSPCYSLMTLNLKPSTLLQYVAGLLCFSSCTLAIQHTATLLNFLSGCRYTVFPTKAQVISPKIKYLGLTLTPTTHSITSDYKALLHDLQVPANKQQVLSFVGLKNFFLLWTLNFATLAQHLYKASQGSLSEPLNPSTPIHSSFSRLKGALLRAPPSLSLTQLNPSCCTQSLKTTMPWEF